MLARVSYFIGHAFREAGEVLEKLGCSIQGDFGYKERLNRHRRVMPFNGHRPKVDDTSFLAPSSAVIGNVKLGKDASVWYNAVIRGDVSGIKIGNETNVQERVIIHGNSASKIGDVIIGNNVTIETGAIIHGCHIGDNCLIGIGAIVSDDCTIESNSMIGPGSVVPPNTIIPSGEFWSGIPAKQIKKLTSEQILQIDEMSKKIKDLAKIHSEETSKDFEVLQKEIDECEYRDDKLAHYYYEGSKPIDSNDYPKQ